MLVEFASVVDALRCAVEVQRGMAERNADVPADRRMLFRIGINLGDVLIEGEDIIGDGVNIAARLEAIAEPGSICISRQAYDQVEGKLALQFRELGFQNLKNIAKPVEVRDFLYQRWSNCAPRFCFPESGYRILQGARWRSPRLCESRQWLAVGDDGELVQSSRTRLEKSDPRPHPARACQGPQADPLRRAGQWAVRLGG
jgi:Adenylate and Guanylate cyclase catalytic domain